MFQHPVQINLKCPTLGNSPLPWRDSSGWLFAMWNLFLLHPISISSGVTFTHYSHLFYMTPYKKWVSIFPSTLYILVIRSFPSLLSSRRNKHSSLCILPHMASFPDPGSPSWPFSEPFAACAQLFFYSWDEQTIPGVTWESLSRVR